MTGAELIGLGNLFVVAIGTGAGISVPFIIAAKKNSRDNFEKLEKKSAETYIKLEEKIDDKFKDIERKLEKANAELLPAYRNGGVVTTDTLRNSITSLEKTLSDRIDLVSKVIRNHGESSSLTEERLVELLKKAFKISQRE